MATKGIVGERYNQKTKVWTRNMEMNVATILPVAMKHW